MVGGDKKEFYVGSDAEYKRGVLKLNYPIENRNINNFDDMEKIWGHIFTNELRVAPEEHNVLLTESSKWYYKENRQKIAQIMFESFNVPGLYIINPAVLSLFGVGKFTGIAMDSGDGGTSIVPIFDGFPLECGIIRLDIAGRDHTKLLMNKLLYEIGCRFKQLLNLKSPNLLKKKLVMLLLTIIMNFNVLSHLNMNCLMEIKLLSKIKDSDVLKHYSNLLWLIKMNMEFIKEYMTVFKNVM